MGKWLIIILLALALGVLAFVYYRDQQTITIETGMNNSSSPSLLETAVGPVYPSG